MPIEIRELVVKATIESRPGSPPASGDKPTTASGSSENGADVQKIVDLIMDRIKNKNER